MRLERERLPECHPQRRAIAVGNRLAPQQQDVDATVGRAVVPQRQRDPAGGIAGVPGLEPRSDALLEVVDHAPGDAAVEIRAAVGGFHRLAPFVWDHFAKGASRHEARPATTREPRWRFFRRGEWSGPEPDARSGS